MKHLYFVRHGESELNARRMHAGQIDTPLTTRGREQARAAGAQAKAIALDLIVSSPLSRALETAQTIASSIGYPLDRIMVNPRFMERSIGSLAGYSWDEIDEDAAEFPDMETKEQLIARARSALRFLRSLPEDNILLVSHGAFSRALRTAINQGSNYADFSEPANATIVKFI